MTRTALIMNGLAELRIRYARQGAKAPLKTKEHRKSDISIKSIDNFKKSGII
jgi:hypothetical protein